jgi:dTDP-4-dehydrorhamnose reductase
MFSVKVLITGCDGQIGRALLKSIPTGVVAMGLSHRDLDITDESAVKTCVTRHSPEIIINAAAYTAVDRAEIEVEGAWRVNAEGPLRLAQAAREVKARLLHISTDFVFDGSSSAPYTPDAKTNPLNVYGRSKEEGERHVLAELPAAGLVLRTSWIYAAEGNNFVRTMLKLMGAGKPVSVVADQVGTPTSARSVAEVLWRLAARPDLHGIHHWTDAGVASWYDFAIAIAEEAAQIGLLAQDATVRPITTVEYPTPARRPRFSVLDKASTVSAIRETPVHWRRQLRGVLREIARG